MSTTKTVNTNSTHTVGKCTLVTHSVVTPSSMGGGYSLHDCATPGAAEVWNCVYPINMASPDGKAFTNGLTVVHRNPADQGSVSVTIA
jgi:hypothetical protein